MPSNDLEGILARMAEAEGRIATLTAEIERLQAIIDAHGLSSSTST